MWSSSGVCGSWLGPCRVIRVKSRCRVVVPQSDARVVSFNARVNPGALIEPAGFRPRLLQLGVFNVHPGGQQWPVTLRSWGAHASSSIAGGARGTGVELIGSVASGSVAFSTAAVPKRGTRRRMLDRLATELRLHQRLWICAR